MSSNPLYHPRDLRPLHMMPLMSASFGNCALEVNPIYAKPLPPNMHKQEWNPTQNVYESIYSEPLNPLLFMQERDDIDSGELCPYSSIYTVPVVSLTNKPLSVSVGSIREIQQLGVGNFGEVALAQTKDLGLDSEAPYTLVVVKKLKPRR